MGSADIDWSILLTPFQNINFLNMGVELILVGLAVAIGVGMSKKKSEALLGITFAYLIFTILGWATQIWLLILLALATGIYKMRNG